MPFRKILGFAALGLACALLMSWADAFAQAPLGARAGVAAAVRGPVQQISYRAPSGIGRNVGGGDEIRLGDRIVTGPGGGLQILLLDGTTFSVGPNTSMVIDEFVFNPATGVGHLAASVTKGTLRVISGRLSRQDQEAIRIRLPMATVGVRGTMVMLSGDANGFFVGLFGIGADNSANRPQSMVFVSTSGAGNGIYRTGFGCTVTPSAPVCNPQPVGPDFLRMLLGQIGGQLRSVNLVEFERISGLDLVTALKLLQTQGGFEQLWQIIDKLQQDRARPGAPPSAAPPSSPPCCSN
ncbi:MAG: FecR family protein [Alphaproteobacteria bacterium]